MSAAIRLGIQLSDSLTTVTGGISVGGDDVSFNSTTLSVFGLDFFVTTFNFGLNVGTLKSFSILKNRLQLRRTTTITNNQNQNRTVQLKTSKNVYILFRVRNAYKFECQPCGGVKFVFEFEITVDHMKPLSRFIEIQINIK